MKKTWSRKSRVRLPLSNKVNVIPSATEEHFLYTNFYLLCLLYILYTEWIPCKILLSSFFTPYLHRASFTNLLHTQLCSCRSSHRFCIMYILLFYPDFLFPPFSCIIPTMCTPTSGLFQANNLSFFAWTREKAEWQGGEGGVGSYFCSCWFGKGWRDYVSQVIYSRYIQYVDPISPAALGTSGAYTFTVHITLPIYCLSPLGQNITDCH